MRHSFPSDVSREVTATGSGFTGAIHWYIPNQRRKSGKKRKDTILTSQHSLWALFCLPDCNHNLYGIHWIWRMKMKNLCPFDSSHLLLLLILLLIHFFSDLKFICRSWLGSSILWQPFTPSHIPIHLWDTSFEKDYPKNAEVEDEPWGGQWK